MDWAALYTSLHTDAVDWRHYEALEREVARWAHKDLAGRDALVIDDVVADTCAMAIVSIASAYGAETFAGFVKSCYLTVRKRALRELARQLPRLPDDIVAPDPIDERAADLLEAVFECLPSLSTRERIALRLRYFDGASANQIASHLGVTTVNARRIGFNARAKLRQCAEAHLRQIAG